MFGVAGPIVTLYQPQHVVGRTGIGTGECGGIAETLAALGAALRRVVVSLAELVGSPSGSVALLRVKPHVIAQYIRRGHVAEHVSAVHREPLLLG